MDLRFVCELLVPPNTHFVRLLRGAYHVLAVVELDVPGEATVAALVFHNGWPYLVSTSVFGAKTLQSEPTEDDSAVLLQFFRGLGMKETLE
jgi:hypothetical protein